MLQLFALNKKSYCRKMRTCSKCWVGSRLNFHRFLLPNAGNSPISVFRGPRSPAAAFWGDQWAAMRCRRQISSIWQLKNLVWSQPVALLKLGFFKNQEQDDNTDNLPFKCALCCVQICTSSFAHALSSI